PHGAGHHAGGHDAVGGTQESSGGQADNPSEIGPGRPGTAEGCYAGPPSHMCDCDTTEADCRGTWTDRCMCDQQ
ncbi:MAG: hypothetical protein VX589_06885, partial [Myxococcota bacterium]|nr:hypothetical protein [Myxococcota bacterium]